MERPNRKIRRYPHSGGFVPPQRPHNVVLQSLRALRARVELAKRGTPRKMRAYGAKREARNERQCHAARKKREK